MMSGLLAVAFFLFSVLFGLVTFGLWLRLGLHAYAVSVLQPISQMVYRLTEPLVLPLGKLLNKAPSRRGRLDLPCLVLLVLVELVKFTLIGALFFKGSFPWVLILAYVVADLIITPCNMLFYALIIRVFMSWVNPNWQNPLANLLYAVTEPSLVAVRRVLPFFAGIDFSPFVVMILLSVITLFVRASLPFQLV